MDGLGWWFISRCDFWPCSLRFSEREWRRGEDRPAVPRGQVRKIPGLPDPTIKPSPLHASQLLIEMARKYSGKLVLYTAGPLTNIALAVHIAPDIVHRIKAVYSMAGAIHVRSKFNFWWDPER